MENIGSGTITREFLAQRVFDLSKEKLIPPSTQEEVWKAIAETSDQELYDFYFRLVKERSENNG